MERNAEKSATRFSGSIHLNYVTPIIVAFSANSKIKEAIFLQAIRRIAPGLHSMFSVYNTSNFPQEAAP
jgi:hypothetical protein